MHQMSNDICQQTFHGILIIKVEYFLVRLTLDQTAQLLMDVTIAQGKEEKYYGTIE